jgi:hypothetical protein
MFAAISALALARSGYPPNHLQMTAHQCNVESRPSLEALRQSSLRQTYHPQGPSQLDSTAVHHRPSHLISLPKGTILHHTPLAWTFPGPRLDLPSRGDRLHPIFQPPTPHIQDDAAEVESELTARCSPHDLETSRRLAQPRTRNAEMGPAHTFLETTPTGHPWAGINTPNTASTYRAYMNSSTISAMRVIDSIARNKQTAGEASDAP